MAHNIPLLTLLMMIMVRSNVWSQHLVREFKRGVLQNRSETIRSHGALVPFTLENRSATDKEIGEDRLCDDRLPVKTGEAFQDTVGITPMKISRNQTEKNNQDSKREIGRYFDVGTSGMIIDVSYTFTDQNHSYYRDFDFLSIECAFSIKGRTYFGFQYSRVQSYPGYAGYITQMVKPYTLESLCGVFIHAA